MRTVSHPPAPHATISPQLETYLTLLPVLFSLLLLVLFVSRKHAREPDLERQSLLGKRGSTGSSSMTAPHRRAVIVTSARVDHQHETQDLVSKVGSPPGSGCERAVERGIGLGLGGVVLGLGRIEEEDLARSSFDSRRAPTPTREPTPRPITRKAEKPARAKQRSSEVDKASNKLDAWARPQAHAQSHAQSRARECPREAKREAERRRVYDQMWCGCEGECVGHEYVDLGSP